MIQVVIIVRFLQGELPRGQLERTDQTAKERTDRDTRAESRATDRRCVRSGPSRPTRLRCAVELVDVSEERRRRRAVVLGHERFLVSVATYATPRTGIRGLEGKFNSRTITVFASRTLRFSPGTQPVSNLDYYYCY